MHLLLGRDGQMNRAVTGKQRLARPGIPDGTPATLARETQGRSCRENRNGTVAAQGFGSVGTTHTGKEGSVDPSVLETRKLRSQPQYRPNSSQRGPGTRITFFPG